MHKNLRAYQCQECKKSYARKAALKNHIKIVHQKLTPYKCQKCKKSYGQKYLLKGHKCKTSFSQNFLPQDYLNT